MEELSPKQIKAAILIGHGERKKKAAKEVKVSPGTISEWLQDPKFIALVNRSKKALMEDTRDMLRGNLPVAVDSIRNLITDAKSEKIRLDAAKFVIENSGIILDEMGLWDTGPQTADEVLEEKEQHELAKLLPTYMR